MMGEQRAGLLHHLRQRAAAGSACVRVQDVQARGIRGTLC
jgi:hypothetical protein